jgi:hypothetical protein
MGNKSTKPVAKSNHRIERTILSAQGGLQIDNAIIYASICASDRVEMAHPRL